MKYLIVTDLEATCDNNPNFDRRSSEIIEIGAVVIDENLNVIDTFQTFIKPIKNDILTDFCKELTKIKQSDVDLAEPFKESYFRFENFCLQYENREFVCWGDYDFNKFKSSCSEIDTDFLFKNHINLKKSFAKTQKMIGKGPGVSLALRSCGMQFIGTPHRGIDDAKNIARLIPYSLHNEIAIKPEILQNKNKNLRNDRVRIKNAK